MPEQKSEYPIKVTDERLIKRITIMGVFSDVFRMFWHCLETVTVIRILELFGYIVISFRKNIILKFQSAPLQVTPSMI